LILATPLGIADNNIAKGQIISTIFFASGIATLLQTALGNRLVKQDGFYGSVQSVMCVIIKGGGCCNWRSCSCAMRK